MATVQKHNLVLFHFLVKIGSGETPENGTQKKDRTHPQKKKKKKKLGKESTEISVPRFMFS